MLIPMDRKRKHHGIITLGSMFIIKGVSHHSPFKGLAKRRKIAMGYFCFNLHCVMNQMVSFMTIRISLGKSDDRLQLEAMVVGLKVNYGATIRI